MKKTEEIVDDFMNKFFGNWREFYKKFFHELCERTPHLLSPIIDIDQHSFKGLECKFDDNILLALFYNLAALMIENQLALGYNKNYSLNYFTVQDVSHEFSIAVEKFVDAMDIEAVHVEGFL